MLRELTATQEDGILVSRAPLVHPVQNTFPTDAPNRFVGGDLVHRRFAFVVADTNARPMPGTSARFSFHRNEHRSDDADHT